MAARNGSTTLNHFEATSLAQSDFSGKRICMWHMH